MKRHLTHFAGRAAATLLVAAMTIRAYASDGIRGDRIDPSRIGAGVIETMDDVIARSRMAPPPGPSARTDPSRRYGEWVVPSVRATSVPHSGLHNIVNKWGDVRIGIGFPEVVDVHGVYIAGQRDQGVWAPRVWVVGYRDGLEVGRTAPFGPLSKKPTWFAIDLCGVDRVIFRADPAIAGAGWYTLDDLTFTSDASSANGPTVVNFDDLGYETDLTGTGYAGLTWEFGTGYDLAAPMPPPRIPPEEVERRAGLPPDHGGGAAEMLVGPSLPDLAFGFEGVIRGDAESTTFPPDSNGAVGIDHYVIAVNRNFAIYDKATGSELSNIKLGDFIQRSDGDPRILFDPHSGRWFVTATDFNADKKIYLAVSLTSDPEGAWFKGDFFTADGIDQGAYPDYPTLGVDEAGIYIGAYMVNGGNTMTLFVVDKAPLLDAEPTMGTVTAFRGLPWEGALQPAVTYGSAAGEYCVSRSDASTLRVRRINPPLTEPTLTELGFVVIPGHAVPPDVPALGSTTALDSIGPRLMNAVYRDGALWTVHTVGVDGRAACRWYQIDPEALSLLQVGTVSDPVMHYFYPSIMVNAAGHVAMGFSGSSPNDYVGAYYTGRRAGDPPGAMATPALLVAGEAPQNNIDGFGRNRWGDYSYCTLDPVDQMRVWTIQEYAHADTTDTSIWGTWVGALELFDCNENDIPDDCDVACGAAGGVCDIPGCGSAPDCDGDAVPDTCEAIVGACCFADGSCCDRVDADQCFALGAAYLGDGVDCIGFPDPVCEPTDTVIHCEAGVLSGLPGTTIPVSFFIENVTDLSSYDLGALSIAAAGSGSLVPICDGCTGGTNEPDCGARIDSSRPDYVFAGLTDDPSVDCASASVSSSISGQGVTVGAAQQYLGEFTMTISEDAAPNALLELTIDTDPAVTFLRDSNGGVLRVLPGGSCVVNVLDPMDCLTPEVEADGAKAVVVRPIGAAPQALLVTGDAADPNVACVSAYIQADGTLGPDPVVQTPAEWGDVGARGLEIIPSATYSVEAECGADRSASVSTTTWSWGEIEAPPNGLITFRDIALSVKAFQGLFEGVTLERADLDPCVPNRTINFRDVSATVGAFQGTGYDGSCALPCP